MRLSLLSLLRRLAQPEELPLRWRYWLVVICFFFYLSLVFILRPLLGGAASSLSAIPIIAAAWFLGFRGANISFVIVSALNLLIFMLFGMFDVEKFFRNNGLTGALLLWATAAFIGHMSDLRRKAQAEFLVRSRIEQSLSTNRAHLQALYQNIQDAVLFVDDQACILEVNPAACRLLGYTAQEFLGADLGVFTAPEIQTQAPAMWQAFLHAGRMQGEYALTCKDGSVITVEILAVSKVLPSENVIILHDITQRRKNEQEIFHLLEAERQNRSLAEALINSSAALSSTLDLDSVLTQILVNVGRVLPHTAANIMLVEGEIAHIVKAQGYSITYGPESVLSKKFYIQKHPNLRYLLEHAKPIAIGNTNVDSRWRKSQASSWIRSYAAAPIIIDGSVIGFLNLDSNTENHYQQPDAERLMAFADQAAIAIRNAQLYRQLQEKTTQAEMINRLTQSALSASSLTEMSQVLADNLLQLFNARGVYITLWHDAKQRPIPTAASGALRENYTNISTSLGEYTLTHLALAQGTVTTVSDLTQVPNLSPTVVNALKGCKPIIIPLLADLLPLGAAIIVYPAGQEITEAQITLAQQVLPQISLAVAKARLLSSEQLQLAETGRTNQLLTALSHMAAKVASATDIHTIFSTLGDELESIGIFCLVGLRDPLTNLIAIRYFSPLHPIPEKWQRFFTVFDTFDPSYPLFHSIVEQRSPVYLVDPIPMVETLLSRFPQSIASQLTHLIGFHSGTQAICLPLIADENVMGIITLWGDDLRESDQAAAVLFSSQVAIAIQKARLISEIQQMVITDELTGVKNRRGLYEKGQQEVERARRFNHPLSLLFVDVDYFKTINDQFGHNTGDELLQQIALRIRENVRDADLIGRYGGDEFLILLVESDLEAALTIASRLLESINEFAFETSAGLISATLSIGVAELNDLDADFESLIIRSDQLLYQAKETGRNRIVS